MQPTLISLEPTLPLALDDPTTLDMLERPRLSLFWGAETPTRALLAALTMMAARGQQVRVFDGGNRFDGYFIARLARRLSSDPHAILERVRLSRAFTCFQLAQLIESAPAAGPTAAETDAGAASRAQPVEVLFVLDLLSTFYDESVPLREAERLLMDTIAHLKRLAMTGPVIVGAREPRVLVKERWTLLDQLQVAADAAWLLRSPESVEQEQLRLFG